MNKQNNPFRHIRLVYRRTSPLVKCVVLAAIVLSAAALILLRTSIQESKQQQAELQKQAIALVQENRELTKNIAELGTVESVKRIAEQELGLVDPNSQFFTPGN